MSYSVSRYLIRTVATTAFGLVAAIAAQPSPAASIGDLNDDGKDDLLLRHADGRWLYNAMDGKRRIVDQSGFADLPSEWSWRFQGIGDFDGDGDGDVLLRHENGRWYYYAMDGRDAPDDGVRLAMTVNPVWQLAAIGDFNGDGTDDVLIRNTSHGRWFYYPILDGAVAAGRGRANITGSANWSLAGVGDLNGDGNDDILLRHINGRWWYYPMEGNRQIVAGRGFVDIETDHDWQLADIGDFDGDERDEILLRHTDGRWYHYPMNGRLHDADEAGSANVTRNLDFQFAGAGDLTGDGKDDVLLRKVSTGRWYLFPMDGRQFIAAGRGTSNVTARREWAMADLATGWDPDEFYLADYNTRFKNYCAVPRTGVDADGDPFPDQHGTTLAENNWLRSWSHDTYLWYDEIEDVDPLCCDTPTYFDLLKTFATTPSGNLKDQFHFSQNTEQRNRVITTGSVGAGYGANWVVLARFSPRDVRVRYTEPNSPATQSGVDLLRGTEVLEVDGVSVVNGSDVNTINGGLWPDELGETHEFRVRDPGSTETRTITMTAAEIITVPVQHTKVIETASGPVGYLLFNTFIVQAAESQLVDAFQELQDANVTDLVLDLRYNGGGFVIIANQLAYMIAGDNASGKVFTELQFNDKHTVTNPFTDRAIAPDRFRTTTIGWSTPQSGIPLPKLDLERVFVLAGPRTCSASELVVNALRGIDVDVVLIGATTCGKPYGFYSQDNCGATYSTVHFRSINAKDFGDYPDGFSPNNLTTVEGISVPGCAVADDFEHQFGDEAEARFAAALQYRTNSTCPTPTSVVSSAIARQQRQGPAITDPTPLVGYMIATEEPH